MIARAILAYTLCRRFRMTAERWPSRSRWPSSSVHTLIVMVCVCTFRPLLASAQNGIDEVHISPRPQIGAEVGGVAEGV